MLHYLTLRDMSRCAGVCVDFRMWAVNSVRQLTSFSFNDESPAEKANLWTRERLISTLLTLAQNCPKLQRLEYWPTNDKGQVMEVFFFFFEKGHTHARRERERDGRVGENVACVQRSIIFIIYIIYLLVYIFYMHNITGGISRSHPNEMLPTRGDL